VGGTYDMSPDHLPFVGRMPGVENWVNVCGFSGHGVMQAPAIGRAVAEEIVDGASHSINVDSLRIERLVSGVTVAKDLVFEPFMIGRVIFDIGGLRHQA
jgi:sarcosine oxidase subunit beta